MIKTKNIPRIALKVLKVRLGKRIPLKVTQYITYRCNYKCAFCGRILNKAEELTTDQIKRCMKEFKKLGTEFWGFNGGEPLLRKDIGELVDYAKRLGLKRSISTNGFFIPNKINQIKNIDLILVSLDGPKEVHDKIRGTGAYKKVIEALKILNKNKVRTLIMTVISKENLDHMEHLLSIVKEYECDWELQPITIHKADIEKKAEEFFPDHKRFLETVDWLIKQKNKGNPITNSVGYLEQMKLPLNSNKIPDCWAGRLVCVMSPDGYVLPCAEMLELSKNYKSLLDVGVKEAFNSLPDMSKCRMCKFSCYMEYNVALGSLFKTGFKSINNIFKGKQFWQ